MTWVQIGVGLAGLFVASAGVALAGWFGIWTMMDRRFAGIWTMMDRRFAEMDRRFADIFADIRTEMRAGFDRVDTRLDALTADVRKLTADVHMLVGRQQERDRAPAAD